MPRLQEFDIAAEAGLDTALVKHYDIDVGNGEILIGFSNGSAGSARVDAIHVVLSGDAFHVGLRLGRVLIKECMQADAIR